MEQNAMTPKQFLENYNASPRHYLHLDNVREAVGSSYNHTVMTVWNMSFERIKYKNPLAVRLLRTIAFLAPDNIPVALFKLHRDMIFTPGPSELVDAPWEQLVDKAIVVIRKYSLVRRGRCASNAGEEAVGMLNDMLFVHRLVQ